MTAERWYEQAWRRVCAKVERVHARVGATFPEASHGGRFTEVSRTHWVAGFWPGLLWQAYNGTGNAELKRTAIACEAQLAQALRFDVEKLHHDVGFMYLLSSVAQYDQTGDEEARKRGLIAASILASRFNPAGNFLRAWPDWDGEDHSGWAIIDCMMNLSLLYWASEQEGDPRYRHIASLHADTVLKTFFQSDDTVNHIVVFDPETGTRLRSLSGQGFAPNSAWSRGLSWAVYGFANCYRHTGNARYLDAAERAAEAFLRMLPEDGIPYWDFKLPTIDGMPRDTSAAACAASGLLELAEVALPDKRERFRAGAETLLRNLYEKCTDWESEQEGILLHATGFYAKGMH
ncbi:MAG: glycoside hydrolase family 88 protein, partial [Cohnella sp.]|nr:glycoside hydrolase family 88 protein [Cohnella sp.]